jgi:hypothetical protein
VIDNAPQGIDLVLTTKLLFFERTGIIDKLAIVAEIHDYSSHGSLEAHHH